MEDLLKAGHKRSHSIKTNASVSKHDLDGGYDPDLEGHGSESDSSVSGSESKNDTDVGKKEASSGGEKSKIQKEDEKLLKEVKSSNSTHKLSGLPQEKEEQ